MSGGLFLSGANWAETPDDASLDITGDIDIRVAAALTDWTPAAQEALTAKWISGSQQSYGFQVLASGLLNIFWDDNGVGPSISDSSTVAPTVADGAILAVRAALEVNVGGGARRTTFYTKATTPATAEADCDSNSGWTQLGSQITGLAATSIYAGTAVLAAGAFSNGVFNLVGVLYSVVVKSGIAGTTVTNPDFYANDLPFTDGAGRSWVGLPEMDITVGIAEETDSALGVTPTTGPDNAITVGIAHETDTALPLLLPENIVPFRSYRPFGTLGCGSWTVQVARRGGAPIEIEVAASSVRMTRTEDEVSTADITFPVAEVPDWCLGALADLRPWVHEVSLLRDGEQAWVGPISSQVTFTASTVTVQARDLFAWMERRVLPFNRTLDEDLSLIFEQFVLDALFLDPSPNIMLAVMASGFLSERTIATSDFKRAADELRDIAAIGIDFTMVGRTMRIRGRGQGDVLKQRLLASHCISEPSASLDGSQAASEWIVTGSSPLVHGAAGGIGTDTGLVTQVHADTGITRTVDAVSAAAELLAASGAEPMTVSCTLTPDAPFQFHELIPGNFIPVAIDFGAFHVAELMLLTGVTGDAGAGTEAVGLTLVRTGSVQGNI